MEHPEVQQAPQIARLAIVTPDFSTYYIPHTTHIGGDKLIKIDEGADHNGECYFLINRAGRIIGRVSKAVPHLVDYYREVDASSHEADQGQ